MKKFLALTALVLGLASCQTEPEGLDVNVGGVVDTVVTVNIPEAETRSAANSAVGAFTDGTCTEGVVRYIMQVYYNGETSADEHHRQVTYSTGTTVSFPVRLVAGRHYNFVVWADVVANENDGDLHYNTTDLKNITLKGEWNAMDETRDAFTGFYDTAVHGDKTPYNGAKSINIDLYRPFAKLRVVTTDYNVLNSYGVTPTYATVSYTTDHRVAFNAFSGEAKAASESGKTHEYEIKAYSDETDAARTIFADYFFAENDVVKFTFNVYEDEAKTKLIKQINFNTDINVKRNYLTTLKGDVLTEGGNIGVTVRPGFGDENADDYNYEVLTSGDQLVNAINAGGSYKVGNDIYVADTRAAIATRAAAGQTTTILNLNGYKITFEEGATIEVSAGTTLIINDESENNTGAIEAGNDAGFVVNNGGALTIESGNIGAGAIENNGTTNLEGGNFAAGAVVNGADGEANISNGDIQPEAVTGNTEDVKNYAAELVAAFTNGGDYTLQADITLANNNSNSAIGYQLPAGKTLNLDLNGFAINASSNEITSSIGALVDVRGTLNVKNGTITTKHVGTDYAWNKGAEIFYVGFGGTLNVENATLENLGGTAMAYCIDLVNADSNGITVNIKNSTLKSPYIPFRVFNNGSGMNNVDIQNTTLDGKYCFWVHIFTNTDTNGNGYKTSTLNIKNLFGGTNTFKFNNTRNAAAIYGFDDELYLDAQGNYLVGDVVSLKSLAKFVNGGNKLQGKSVKLTADIDLAGEEWTPIGNSTNTFNGTFDGNGKSIKNLNIVETEAKEGKAYIGFFGYANNATIKNVTFENVNLNIPCLDIDHSQGHIGAVAGSLEGTSTIENVTVKGDIKVYATQEANGASRVAVVAGGNSYGNVTMENVHVIANEGSYLIANNNAGALAGQLQGKSVCKNCSSNIDVTVNKFFAGGLIGLAAGDQLFENCHTTGDIAVVAGREGRAHDQYRVGGIAGGWADGKNNVCTLTNCSYTGNVSGKNSDGSVADPLDYAGYVGRGYTLNGCQGSTVVIDGIKYIQKYDDAENAGIYYVVDAEGNCFVGDADTLVAALKNEYDVLFTDNIKIDPAAMSNAYGTTGINVEYGQTIDGNGHILDIKGAGGTWDSGINTTGGLIKNLTVTGSFRGIFINHNSTHAEKVVLENVTIEGTTYTISCDQGTGNGLEATNSTFNGWTSYAATLGDAKFTDCYFGEGNGYAYCRPYAPTEFVGCQFEAGFEVDARAAVTFENCTLDGVDITAENVATLVTSNTANATVK